MVEQATNLIFQMKNNIQNTELIIDLLNNLESIICEKFDGNFSSFTRKFYHYDWKDFDYLLLNHFKINRLKLLKCFCQTSTISQ